MTPALHKALLLTCFSIALVLFAGCDSNDMAMETPIEFGEATYQVSEASESLDVDVVLDQPADQDLTVPLSISGSAIAGVDYEALDTEAVTIEQNSTTGTLTITPIDNASIDSESRTIVLSVDADELDGYTGGQTAETEITIMDNEMEGSYTLSFQEPSYTTNEFNQDTVDVVVELNQPLPTALEVSLETGGSATSAN